jgi:hypothetical protein
MADHAEVEYATATGNDYEEHENTYEGFLLFASVGIVCLLSILIALTLGGVMGVWWACGVILLLAMVAAFYGLATHSHAPGIVVFVLGLLALAAYGWGAGAG